MLQYRLHQRVLQRSVFHIQSQGKGVVKPINVLVAIFSEKECHSVFLLNKNGLSRLDVVSYLSHGPKEKKETDEIDSINSTENTKESKPESDYLINLNNLAKEKLLPEIVQVGNEINPMILQGDKLVWPIDWERNSNLINKGIKAVRDISSSKNKKIEIMLHIAQPENGLWWFEQASAAGVTDYDWIGLSYYPMWSEYDLNSIDTPIKTLIETYNKRLMIVETGYPFTLNNADSANNIFNKNDKYHHQIKSLYYHHLQVHQTRYRLLLNHLLATKRPLNLLNLDLGFHPLHQSLNHHLQ